MDLKLDGKKAFVAGASAGLGAAAAMELAAEGAKVTINSRSKKNLEETADTIKTATGSAPEVRPADLSNQADLEQLAKEIAGEGYDIFISNSGGPPPGQFTDLPPNAYNDASNLLLRPAIRLTRALIDGMIERKWGRLIYITSISVLQPVDNLLLSNTYRAAVTGFVKTVSNNYAKHGLTANCVCPGYTATERLNELAENIAEKEGKSAEEVLKGFGESTPVGRVGEPEELAALITFLASERAAYITGGSIPVDGGANKSLI